MNPPDQSELSGKQQVIDELISLRYDNEENDFLHITEMNQFQKFELYKDTYPLFNIRMRLWKAYMYMRLIRWSNFFASRVISHPLFESCSIMLIVVNSIFLALEDPTKSVQAQYLEASESIFLYLYTMEMVLKILGLGFILNRGSYLRDPWNLLDFIIVVSGYIPMILQGNTSINLSGLRSLRVMRPLKTVTTIKKLRSLIVTIFSAIPYLLEIMVVLIFVFLIFAIAGLQLFSGLLQNSCSDIHTGKLYTNTVNNQGPFLCSSSSCPQGNLIINSGTSNYTELVCAKNNQNPDFGITSFDNIFSAFLQVYIVTTLEGWTKIMGYVQRTFGYVLCIYFILIVFIGAFFLINLTLAVITIKFNESQQNSKKEEEMRLKHCTSFLYSK